MDKNYLNSLVGSPYVDESLWDRVKSRGAAGIQRYKGVVGSGWKPLDEAKLDSLWNSFKKKATSLVQDFNTNVLPNINRHRKQDLVTHQTEILNFQKLGNLLSPRQFGGSQLQNILVPRRQNDPSHDNDPFYPSNPSHPNDPSKLEEGDSDFSKILRESGIGKFFRPYSLTQALMSNDTGKVLMAYKSQLKKLYNEFINDVKTILKLPDTTFVGRNIVNQKPDWAPTLNQWETVIGVEKSVPAPQASDATAAPTPTDPPEPPEPAAPTGTAPEPTAGSPSSTVPAAAPPPEAGIHDADSTTDPKLPDELNADVIVKAAKLIIKRVKDDWERSKHYFESPLPSSWDVGKVKVPTPTDLSEADTSDPDEKHKDFLYKIAAEYDKSRTFSHNLGAFKHGNVTYEVFWSTGGLLKHGKENKVLLKKYTEANGTITTSQVILFYFFDHEIDPRSKKMLTIQEMVQKAHPDKSNLFSAEDIAKFETVQDDFQRAMFAVVDRKSMEFKSMSKNSAIQELMGKDGWDKSKATVYVNKAHHQLKAEGNTKPSIQDYVETARELSSTEEYSQPSPKGDALKALIIAKHGTQGDLIPLVNQAVAELGEKAAMADIVDLVLAKKKAAAKSPAAVPVNPPTEPPKSTIPLEPTPSPTEPSPVTPTEPPTPPKGSTQEQQMENWNKGLESIGVDKLNSVKEMSELFSLKGLWNRKMITLAQNKDKPELLDYKLGKGFDKKHKKIWIKLVSNAKAKAKMKATKSPPTNEGLISKRFINPFVSINFVH